MVAVGTCFACADGDHENHVYWLAKPARGVLGGHVCGCGGECVRRPPHRYWWSDAIEQFVQDRQASDD